MSTLRIHPIPEPQLSPSSSLNAAAASPSATSPTAGQPSSFGTPLVVEEKVCIFVEHFWRKGVCRTCLRKVSEHHIVKMPEDTGPRLTIVQRDFQAMKEHKRLESGHVGNLNKKFATMGRGEIEQMKKLAAHPGEGLGSPKSASSSPTASEQPQHGGGLGGMAPPPKVVPQSSSVAQSAASPIKSRFHFSSKPKESSPTNKDNIPLPPKVVTKKAADAHAHVKYSSTAHRGTVAVHPSPPQMARDKTAGPAVGRTGPGVTAMLTSGNSVTLSSPLNAGSELLYQQPEEKVWPKDSPTVETILHALKSNLLYKHLDKEQQMRLVDIMAPEDIKAGTKLLRQAKPMLALLEDKYKRLRSKSEARERGTAAPMKVDESRLKRQKLMRERGDIFYVVDKGEFSVEFEDKETNQRKKAGDCFGFGVVLQKPSSGSSPKATPEPVSPPSGRRGGGPSATVKALVDSHVWQVTQVKARRVLAEASTARLQEYEHFLRNVTAFSCLFERERRTIAEALELRHFKDGEAIVREGEEGETFYILKSGKVRILVKNAAAEDGAGAAPVPVNPDAPPTQVAEYTSPGDYFGELALRSKQTRAATVIANGDVECLTLDKDLFTLLLGPLEDIFQARVVGYKEFIKQHMQEKSQPRQRKVSLVEHSRQSEERKKISLSIKMDDLKIFGTLGRGAFGHVQLVEDKEGKVHALKSVSKALLIQMQQANQVISEKNALEALNHPFIIQLRGSFKDAQNLYLLLEPCLGGEVGSLLKEKGKLDEGHVRFITACVVSAFEYMHSKGMAYRDMKPENLIIDSQGYVKIADFGFAKTVGSEKTFTLCGTEDYMAPEIVSAQGHGMAVDWWTLGVLIYELLTGRAPFYDDNPMQTQSKILSMYTTYPSVISPNAKDLITKLLVKASVRLGTTHGGSQMIRDHPFFAGMDWKALTDRTLKPPYVPAVLDEKDLSNFSGDDMSMEGLDGDGMQGIGSSNAALNNAVDPFADF